MLIRVSSSVGVWGFHSETDSDYELWFTHADPKPQEINVDELPVDMARALLEALHARTLIEVNERGREVLQETYSLQALRPAVAELGISPGLQIKAKKLLSGGVSSVRREVAMQDDALLLSTASAVEKSQKNRKTVIDLLERQLVKSAHLRAVKLDKSSTKLETAYAIDIEEETEEEEVVITFGTQPLDLQTEELNIQD